MTKMFPRPFNGLIDGVNS